jgi:hypothetical protein
MKKKIYLLLLSLPAWLLFLPGCDSGSYEDSPAPRNQSISVLLKNLPADAVGKTVWFYAVNSSGDTLNTELARAMPDSILTFQAPAETPYKIGILITSDKNWNFSDEGWPEGYLVESDWLEDAIQYLEIDSYGEPGDPGYLASIVTCTISNPEEGDYYNPDEIVNLSVWADYPDGYISEVVFKVDGQVIETINYREPGDYYKFQWNTKGKQGLKYYTLEVTAKNNLGQTATAKVRIYLTQDEVFGPSCDIVNVYKFDTDSIYVEAYAYANNDNDTISLVDFYFDGVKKVTDRKGNGNYYEARIGVKSVAAGVHEVKAVATDSKNRTKSSMDNYTLTTGK